MATIVASRFALLSVDDDDDDDLSSKKKKVPNKKSAVVKPQNSVKTNGNSKKKKKHENTQTQSSKNQKLNSGNMKKKKQTNLEQMEEWKQRDTELVEENFEEDLSKAILLSKLDYEEKKDFYESIKKSEEEKKANNNKTKKRSNVMTLNDFTDFGSQSVEKDLSKKEKTEKLEDQIKFFDMLDDDIKNEITKEHLLDVKRRTDLNSQESLILVLYKAYIEKQDREINQLKEEVEQLHVQLRNVKTRNTKLCQIIANGEMKDKAEILMEVERLQTIKDELSSEVATLHIQLEQERSKVRQLTGDHKNKDKSKKHHGCFAESQ